MMCLLGIALPILKLCNYRLASLDSRGLRRSASVYFPPLFLFFPPPFFFFCRKGTERRNNRLNRLPRESVFWIVMALPGSASAKARVASFPFLALPRSKFPARQRNKPVPPPRPGARRSPRRCRCRCRPSPLAARRSPPVPLSAVLNPPSAPPAPHPGPASLLLSVSVAGCAVCLEGGC